MDLAASQVPLILGVSPPSGLHYLVSAAWSVMHSAQWVPGCIAVAAATMACLLGGRRLHPLFPGALLATALGCVASAAGLPVGATVGAVSATLPSLIDPRTLPWHLLPQLACSGVAIAVAGFAESAAISARFASEDGDAPWDGSRELVAHGVSNLLVAAVGGFPVSGSLSRTSLARTAGATSQRAHAVTGIAVVAFLPLGAALLATLPRAALGGLVTCAMMPLMAPPPAMRLRALAQRASRVDFALGWATMLASLACSPRLERGLLVGLALWASVAVWRAAATQVVHARRALA